MSFVFKPIKKVVDKVEDIVEDVVDDVKDIGSKIDDEVFQPVKDVVEDAIDWAVDEIVDPVVDMGQDILEAAGEDPLKTIATIAAIATGNAWMIPLIDGAAVLADGGDIEDAAKAAAISYVASAAGSAVGTAASATATEALGASVSASTAATVSNIVKAGTKSATTALVYGQDPLKAFVTGGANAFVAASLGKISETMTEKFGDSFEDLNDGVKDSIYAGVSAEISGGALSPEQLSNVIMKNAAIGGTMSKFLQENAGFDAAQAAILTNAVTSAVTKTILGNPDAAGEAFFNSISAAGAEALKTVIDKPVNTAIDKISGAYKTTEEKALALDNKTKAYNKIINDISVTENAHNDLLDELNGKITKQDELKQKYLYKKAILDDAKNIMSSDNPYSAEFVDNLKNSVNEAADAYNTFKDNLATDYEVSYKPALDAYNKTHADYIAQLPDAKTEFDTATSEYDTSLKYMNTKYEDFNETLKPATAAINKSIALSLSNDFDEDAYKAYHGLDADTDVYGHFLENSQKLPTNASGFATMLDKFHDTVLKQSLANKGINVENLNPDQLQAALDYVVKEIKNPESITGIDFESFSNELKTIASLTSGEVVKTYPKGEGVSAVDIANGDAKLVNVNNEYVWQKPEFVDGKLGGIYDALTGETNYYKEIMFNGLAKSVPEDAVLTKDAEGNVTKIEYPNGSGLISEEVLPPVSLPDLIKKKVDAGENIPSGFMSAVLDLGEAAGKLLDEYVGTPIYDASKKVYDAYVSEGAKDAIGTTASVIGGATGETLKAISGLAVLAGANPNNSLGKFADNLISASGDLQSEEYANALGEIGGTIADYDKQWREDNPGQEPSTAKKMLLKAQAIYGAAWDNPVEFLSEYVVKEIIQEVPLLLVSGGVGNIAKKALLEAGEAYATKIATKASLGTALTLDATEAFGGTAAGAFDEAYATAIKTGMSEQEATDYAIDIAQAAGTTAVITLAATAGIGGQALAKSVLGDKVDDVSTGAFNTLFKKIKEGGTVTVKEGVTESIEEGLPALVTGMSLAMIDPTYDVAGNVTGAAILGKIAGAGTSGGIYTGNAVADALMSVNSNVINAVGNASDSTAAAAALADIGITDNVILNNILNTSYDTQYVSTAEAAKAFENQNPDYVPTEAEIESFVSNRPDSEVATLVAGYIDKRYLDVDEVKAAAEAAGITLTDEQAEKFVGQNPDETEALNAAIEDIKSNSLFYTDGNGDSVFAGYYPNMSDGSVPYLGGNRPTIDSEDVQDIVDEATEENAEAISELETSLTELIEENDGDVNAALDELADNLGTTEDNILEKLNTTETELTDKFETAISDVEESVTNVEESVTNLETSLTELIEENNGDVSAALDELADNLGTTEDSILEELGTTEANLTEKFEAGISGVEESVSNLETSLTALIEENNGDVNAALDELADNLGTTEANILAELGTTEANLTEKFETGISELEGSIGTLSSDLAALGLDVDTIADLIGKPARKVTETDIDFVIDLIAQENVSEELITQYDVTGDGIVDINDQNMLSDKLQGNDVTFADTSMFNPATGLYAEMDTKNDAVTDMITDMNTQINTQTNQQNFAEFQKLLAESDDAGGQRVDVKSGDKVKLDYMYDIGGDSIFATPQQEGMFGSPFGQRDAMQPANQPLRPFSRASGFAQGGQVEDENDMLLRILGET